MTAKKIYDTVRSYSTKKLVDLSLTFLLLPHMGLFDLPVDIATDKLNAAAQDLTKLRSITAQNIKNVETNVQKEKASLQVTLEANRTPEQKARLEVLAKFEKALTDLKVAHKANEAAIVSTA